MRWLTVPTIGPRGQRVTAAYVVVRSRAGRPALAAIWCSSVTVRAELTAGPQRRPPLSAVARNTGFPAAIVARMLLDGVIRARGVRPPEECVPVEPFLRALAVRGLMARRRVVRLPP